MEFGYIEKGIFVVQYVKYVKKYIAFSWNRLLRYVKQITSGGGGTPII